MENSPIAKFFDKEVKPPAGGWLFVVDGVSFHGYSESEITAEVERWRKNNGTFVSAEEVKRELWEYWCDHEPRRCVGGNPRPSVMVKSLVSAVVKTVKAAITGEPVIESAPSKKSRVEICNACEFLNKANGRCRQCGCFVKVKTALAQEHCPIGRW